METAPRICNGIRLRRDIEDISVLLGPLSPKTKLSVIHKNGTINLYPISKKVVEALIGSGIDYQG